MLDIIALILTIIGGINWGLIGIFQFDLVAWIFGGQDAILSRIIYTLVGIAALWCISLFFRDNDLVDPVKGTKTAGSCRKIRRLPAFLFRFLKRCVSLPRAPAGNRRRRRAGRPYCRAPPLPRKDFSQTAPSRGTEPFPEAGG